MTIFAPATRRGLFVDWAFFDGSEISSEFVGGQCASWRFPPKAAVSACSRHSFVEGIMNGGLDVTQNRRSTLKIHYGRTKLPALQRFFLSPSGGAGSLGLFGLFLLLCGCLFQPRKALIADDVFNPAGVGLRSFWVNACGDDKLLGKKAMALVDFSATSRPTSVRWRK